MSYIFYHNKINTMRYYFIPTRIAVIYMTDHNKCWQGYKKLGSSYIVFVLIFIGMQLIWAFLMAQW